MDVASLLITSQSILSFANIKPGRLSKNKFLSWNQYHHLATKGYA